MLFDFDYSSKGSNYFWISKYFFTFFIENLCFCSLKIAVCVPKIPIGRKKLKIPIRLKITDISKNYRLKIAVRVRACVRMYARAYDCQDSTSDTRRTHDHRQSGKACIYRYNCRQWKKSTKKVKKNLEIWKSRRIFVAVIKKQTSLTIKSKQYENKHNYRQSKTDY